MTDMWWGASIHASDGASLEEQVELAARLGVGTVRLGIDWPRLQPEGHGELTGEVVAQYRSVLRHARTVGMRTVLGWSGALPAALAQAGGWGNRQTPDAFAAVAGELAAALGSDVDLWVTLERPWERVFRRHDRAGSGEAGAVFAAAHHLSLGHGLASQAIRSVLGPEVAIAVDLDLHVVHARDPESAGDLEAVGRVVGLGNHLFLGPLLEGSYPMGLLSQTREFTDWNFIRPGDLVAIRQRIDALVVSYGAVHTVASAPGARPGTPWSALHDVEFLAPPPPHTASGQPIAPAALGELVGALDNTNPGLPLVVRIESAVFTDELNSEGRVHDAARVSYLHDHITELVAAREAGVSVAGLLVPLTGRAGIVHESAGGRSMAKDSGRWYAALTAAGGEVPDAAMAWTLPDLPASGPVG